MPVTSTPDRSASAGPRPRARVAELPGDVGQQRPVGDGAPGFANRLLDDVGVGEMEEERDQIGEALVERGHVDVGRIEKGRPQAVEQRMRRLVSDDVVAERGADQTAFQREARRLLVRRGNSRTRGHRLRGCSQHWCLEAERPHDEPQRPVGGRGRRPRDVAAESASERRVGEAADGIHHLHDGSGRWSAWATGRSRGAGADRRDRARRPASSSGAPRLLTAKSDPIGPGSSFSYGTSTVATPPMRSDTDGSSV